MKIIMTDEQGKSLPPCSFPHFIESNRDEYSVREILAMYEDLLMSGRTVVGGGASPQFEIERA